MNNNIARDAVASLAALFVVACTSPRTVTPLSPCSGNAVSDEIPVEEVPASPGWDLLRDGINLSIQVEWFNESISTLNISVYDIEDTASVRYAVDDDRVRMEDCYSTYYVHMKVDAKTTDSIFGMVGAIDAVSFDFDPVEDRIPIGFQITTLVEEADVLSEAIDPPPNEETEAGFNFGMGDDGTRASLHQTNGVELFNSVF